MATKRTKQNTAPAAQRTFPAGDSQLPRGMRQHRHEPTPLHPATDLIGPPVAMISSPAKGAVFKQNQIVATSFTCADTTVVAGDKNGPGIATCTDSGGKTSGSGQLKTNALGWHVYGVRAISTDGQSGGARIQYYVATNIHIKPPPPPHCTGTACI